MTPAQLIPLALLTAIALLYITMLWGPLTHLAHAARDLTATWLTYHSLRTKLALTRLLLRLLGGGTQ